MTMDSAVAGDLCVSRTCFVQTAETRFGSDVLNDLRTFVFQGPQDTDLWFPFGADPPFDDDDDDDADEDVDVDEIDAAVDPYTLEAADGTPMETDPSHAEHGFPRIATLRNNLTALSQKYNLYFAAYQDRIYVYQPRRIGPRILPAPSLILHPRASKIGEHIGGTLEPRFPHQINHIIVGNLGNYEIVLLAYDDGDVAAYYTHVIARCIKIKSDEVRKSGARARKVAHPKLFFHENVGKSAWGIAIHERSRLIAVGSNLHEVVVFAFSLSRPTTVTEFTDVDDDDSPWTKSGERASVLEKHVQSRTRTWRIVLPLGRMGHNIPNVTFLDDEAGEADRVVAMDVTGNVWFLDIWKVGAPPIRWAKAVPREHRQPGSNGWGVLVLPSSSFRPTKTVFEALGVPGSEVIAGTRFEDTSRVWLDISCSLYYVPELSPDPATVFKERAGAIYGRMHAVKPAFQEDDLSDVWDSDSESDDEAVTTAPTSGTPYPASANRGARQRPAMTVCPSRPEPKLTDLDDDVHMSRCILPSFGDIKHLDGQPPDEHKSFARDAFNRQRRTEHVEFHKADDHLPPPQAIRDLCVLRTYQGDIELQPMDRDAPCIDCRYALAHYYVPGSPQHPWDYHPAHAERVSMLVHVPELGLVAVGSPSGRVALLSLTRTARRLHLAKLRRGFRVECVLPRRNEDEKRLRPNCSLVGMAMSPVPRRGGLELRPRRRWGGMDQGPVVYRLMMHYKDHTVLMYDVWRRGDEDELLVL